MNRTEICLLFAWLAKVCMSTVGMSNFSSHVAVSLFADMNTYRSSALPRAAPVTTSLPSTIASTPSPPLSAGGPRCSVTQLFVLRRAAHCDGDHRRRGRAREPEIDDSALHACAEHFRSGSHARPSSAACADSESQT